MKKQTIPTLLETQDRIVLGLTARQFLILCIGICWSYLLFDSFSNVGNNLVFVAVLLLSAIPAGIAVLVAFVTISGQSLDKWGMIWLLYEQQPKSYTWQFFKDEQETQQRNQTEKTLEQDE